MEELAKKIASALESAFDGMFVAVSANENTERVGGVVTWDGFAGMRQLDRQDRLWSVLRNELGPDDIASIGMILTVTPQEIEAMQDAAA